MSKTLIAAVVALFIAAPLPAQHSDYAKQDAAQSSDLEALKKRDQDAATAFETLNTTLRTEMQSMTEQGAQEKFLGKVREHMAEFATEWKGTESAIEALTTAGMISVHALSDPKTGISYLKKAYTAAKARPKEMGTDSAQTGLMLAEAMVDSDMFEDAKVLLKDLTMAEGPTKERAQQMLHNIDTLANLANGKIMPTFAAKDLDGGDISPEQYRGKVVLVDFWATWCGPCVAEMPHVVEVYNKYKADGFDVIGVSLDSENAIEKIKEFSEKNNMPWRHAYDGKGWQMAVAQQFGIRSIPATFLLDRNGVIRAKNLRGAELAKKVAELMTEQL